MSETMTKEEAKAFDSYSERNAAIILSQLSCDCVPYVTVLTYQRWKALGYQVKKGEHGIKLLTYKTYEVEEDSEIVTRKRPWKSTVFCKCQVKEKE